MKAAAVLIAATAWLPAAHATSVLPLYLDEVIDTAAVAFEGTCVSNRSERDPATGFVVTYTTFEVKDVLKGDVGATHMIKQIGGALPGEQVDRRIDGVPRFTVGEDYVVFLAGVSSIGFSSPIGLSQGRFEIKGKGKGRTVRNGRDLRDMTSRMQSQLPAAAGERIRNAATAVHEMDADDFKQAVRGRAGGRK